MLVRTFEIQVDRRLHVVGMRVMHALVRQARIGPHVHDVGDLLVVRRRRRLTTRAASRSNQASMPSFSTRAATSSISSCVRGCSSCVCLCTNSAIGTPQVRWRDRHQSGRFSIMPADALLAPGGRPLHLLDVAQRVRAQALLVHADEPLRRGAEDHRRLVAPAMRIAVLDLLVLEQPAAALELLDEHFAALVHLQAGDERRALAEAAVAHHRVVDRQAVFLADRRSRPGHARARCARRRCRPRASRGRRRSPARVSAGTDARAAGARARSPVELRQHLALAEAVTRETGIQQLVREHQQLRLPLRDTQSSTYSILGPRLTASFAGSVQGVVVQIGIDTGNASRCASKFTPTRRAKSAGVDDAEFHVDRGRSLVFVLHFRFGQRRAAVEAPVDGLRALI